MGFGFPAAIGAQFACPDDLVVAIVGDGGFQMTLFELATAALHKLPLKILVLNNHYLGMVRQWQELLHGERYSNSYTESLPDFVKLAEAYGGVGLRAQTVDELDGVIEEMLKTDRITIVDVCVEQKENCFPMIPSGKAHNEMILSPDAAAFDKSLV